MKVRDKEVKKKVFTYEMLSSGDTFRWRNGGDVCLKIEDGYVYLACGDYFKNNLVSPETEVIKTNHVAVEE